MSPMSVFSQCFLESGICAFSKCQALCTFCIQFAVRFLTKVLTSMGHGHSDFNRTWFPPSEVEISWQLTLEMADFFYLSTLVQFYVPLKWLSRSKQRFHLFSSRSYLSRTCVILKNADWSEVSKGFFVMATFSDSTCKSKYLFLLLVYLLQNYYQSFDS